MRMSAWLRPRLKSTRKARCSATCGSARVSGPCAQTRIARRAFIALSRTLAADRRNQTVEMAYYLNVALDNGVKPAEISEIMTHLAFYSGWSNAMAAVVVAKDVFAERKIAADQLPAASPNLLALNEAAEADRASESASSLARSFRAWCSTHGCSVP